MGFNTAISICNDNFSDYARRPARFFDAVEIGINDGYEGWGITVHRSIHADITQLIAVGGNFSTSLLRTAAQGWHHTEAGQLSLLKALADHLGYRVVKSGKAK